MYFENKENLEHIKTIIDMPWKALKRWGWMVVAIFGLYVPSLDVRRRAVYRDIENCSKFNVNFFYLFYTKC